MEFIDKEVKVNSKSDVFYIYPIGDVHIGAYNCAESHFARFVDYIAKKKNSYWFGGGDLCNCITLSDKRSDIGGLADWIFTGDALSVKERLSDIARQERLRFVEMVKPIKDKCLGLLMGNHEFALQKYSSNGHHFIMCDELKTPNLTDTAFIRIKFNRNGSGTSVIFFVAHGWGGGRSKGAEPNHLMRFTQIADADIYLRGHSHTFRIEPPEPRLYIPRKGRLPDECLEKEIYSANWGTWLKSYKRGPSTYDSRSNYPPRPLGTVEIEIKPFHDFRMKSLGEDVVETRTRIEMKSISP